MSLAKIIGHDRPLAVLRRAFVEGRVASAYLFTGPPNVGKLTAAVEFAKLLNCTDLAAPDDPSAVDCCDACDACQRIAAGSFADVLVVQPLIRIGTAAKGELAPFEGAMLTTDQVAEVIAQANMRLSRGRHKVIIVARAETMNPEAANRLLKTLEEPPEHTTLILTTSNPSALLPTIVSRCQRLAFHPVPLAELVAGLQREAPDADQSLMETAARLSGGRVGWALTLVRNPIALQVRAELLELLSSLPHEPYVSAMAMAERLIELAEQWWLALNPGESAADVLSRARDRVRRVALDGLLDLVASVMRDIMLLASGYDRSIINADAADALAELAARTTPDRARRGAMAVELVQRHLRGNANIRLALELLTLQLMQSLQPAAARA